uniref:TIR domain-containing protein n=1 Tax=Salix viminalis TaxID=40686 RepID=A0A6N2MZJ9_SALVM
MASTSLQGITSSPSSSPPEYIYDVFLSFRGKDTRNNFTSHLYSNLVQRGIDVYMDDRELERGKAIEPALWKAIEESRFSVVVFSRDYASSPWCLDELVKIVQCMKEMGQTVLPVFYDVDPSEVAERKRKYEEAFVEHEQNFEENLEKVRNWKHCLATVANLSGWDVRNRNESESIKIIVEYILYKLSVTMPTINKNLVGIDSRLEVLNGYIGEEVGEPIFIGVCGMGGIGKTTVARVVYDRIHWQFDGSCFLANVKEVFVEKDGPRHLQEQLLSEILMERATVWDSSRGIDMIRRRLRLKKILLILDDVDDQKQLEFLAAERGWFGSGSRIIITSRDKKVLTRYDDARIYEAEKLNDDDALMLFSHKAFKNFQPAEDFLELSKQVVGYANGLPLALEVIGSFLHGRDFHDWGSAIDRLNEIPDREIIDVLHISFDGLHELEKKIFLDIACFLKGFKKDRIVRILNGCGFHANIGTQVLIEKYLISVAWDQVWMHNLLQIMGKEIVRCESPKEPGRCSRLWRYEDVCLALMDNTGKEKIEAIFLDMPGITEAQWNMEVFSKMSKLRLLKINNVQLSEGPEDLSNMLRFLEWHFYPSKSLPACLQVDELVELHMPNSSIEQLWHGHKRAVNLKIIDLSNSLSLVRTPDFTGIPNLKRLILEGCTSLYEVHPSLGRHKKLLYVNLMNCISVRTLPSNLEMESLGIFSLDGCSELEKFPDIVGNMNKLMVLRLDETGIIKLSSSIHYLIGLGLLSMNNCKNLTRIPEGISCLKSLKKLDLSGCSRLEYLPTNLGEVESLEEFDLTGTSIQELPASISLLKNLKVLYLDGCKRIVVLPSLSGLCSLEVLSLRDCHLREGALPKNIGCLSSLMSLNLSGNDFVSLPRSINKLSRLEMLVLEDCRMLESLPEVPYKVHTGKEKIEAIFLDMPGIIEAQWNMQVFSKMSKLRLLKINNVQLSEGPEDLSNMLRFLEWNFYPSKSLPNFLQVDELVELHMPNSSIEQLWYGHKSALKLEMIDLSNSLSLVRTPDFTSIPNLKRLILEGCTSLYEVHPSLGHHKKLQYVNLMNCRNVKTLPSNLEMESLERIVVLPYLSDFCSLEVLSLRDCHLKEGVLPEDIGCLSSLMSLYLSQNNFVSLPRSINELSELETLVLEDCRMLESLPEVPSKVQTPTQQQTRYRKSPCGPADGEDGGSAPSEDATANE